MKINNLIDNQEIVSIEDYLRLYDVRDVQLFVHPNGAYIENSMQYNNIKEAIQLLKYHILRKDTIYIIVDSDVDGFTSSCIMYNYIKKIEPQCKQKILFHEGKIRGLDDINILNRVLEEKPDLLIIPDANSNVVEPTKKVFDNGTNVLVLDHHQIDTPIDCGVLVSNQVGNVDPCGSGCVVTHKFLQALDTEFEVRYSRDFIDLCALSIISDSMNVTSMQNREYLYWGLLNNHPHITNGFLEHCIARWVQSEDYTQKDIAFSVVPKYNAVIRKADIDEMQKLFLAFCDMCDYDDVCVICEKAHNHQVYIVNKFVNKYIDEIDDSKSIIVCKGEDFPRNYSGLIAAKLMSKTNKPVILGAEHNGAITGSCRSPMPIRDELSNNEYVEFAQGHEQAFGIQILSDKFDDFISSLDALNLSTEPNIEVLQTYPIKSIPMGLFGLYEPYRALWGHGLPSPKFYITDIHITNKNVQVIGKKNNTLRIKYNNITVIIFNVSDVDKEKFMCYNRSTKKLNLNVIGSLELNYWNGNSCPQIIVDNFEVNENTKSLEDLF